MTTDELAAIRERCARARNAEIESWHPVSLLRDAVDDIPALLAEVDELQARYNQRDRGYDIWQAACKKAEAEVERLRATKATLQHYIRVEESECKAEVERLREQLQLSITDAASNEGELNDLRDLARAVVASGGLVRSATGKPRHYIVGVHRFDALAAALPKEDKQ